MRCVVTFSIRRIARHRTSDGSINLLTVTVGTSADIAGQSQVRLGSLTAGGDVSISSFGMLEALGVTASGSVDMFSASSAKAIVNGAQSVSAFAAGELATRLIRITTK